MFLTPRFAISEIAIWQSLQENYPKNKENNVLFGIFLMFYLVYSEIIPNFAL